MAKRHPLTLLCQRQLATILSALRYRQSLKTILILTEEHFHDDITPLDDNEIDTLCEEVLNNSEFIYFLEAMNTTDAIQQFDEKVKILAQVTSSPPKTVTMKDIYNKLGFANEAEALLRGVYQDPGSVHQIREIEALFDKYKLPLEKH